MPISQNSFSGDPFLKLKNNSTFKNKGGINSDCEDNYALDNDDDTCSSSSSQSFSGGDLQDFYNEDRELIEDGIEDEIQKGDNGG